MKQQPQEKHAFSGPGPLATVFFGSKPAAFMSSLLIIAVATLLYFAYLQVQEAVV